jgi:6-phosphogluconolactonase (cycloisomerase 2 family)
MSSLGTTLDWRSCGLSLALALALAFILAPGSARASTTFTAVPGSPFATSGNATSVAAAATSAGNHFLAASDDQANDISVFSIDPMSGALTPVPGSPFPTGGSPEQVVFGQTAAGKTLLATANYGTVAVFSVDPATGTLTAVPGSPFSLAGFGGIVTSVSITSTAAGKTYLAAAAGGGNKVFMYAVDPSTGALSAIDGSPFPTGSSAPNVNLYSLAFVSTAAGNTFLATANVASSTDSLSMFSVDPSTGVLTPVSGSPFPVLRAVSIAFGRTAAGKTFLAAANDANNSTSVYSVDPASGALVEAPGSPFTVGHEPVSVAFGASSAGDTLLATANRSSDNVSVFSLDRATGALTALPGSPLRQGATPGALHLPISVAFEAIGPNTFLASANFDNLWMWKASTVAPPTLAINNVTVTDDGRPGTTTPARFTVSLSHPSEQPVNVDYATTDITAASGADYVQTSGTLTIPAGATSATIAAAVRGDNADEPVKTFALTLSNPVNATIDNAHGTATILDDDRNGAFVCRASPLRAQLLTLPVLEPVTANAPLSPCLVDQRNLYGLAPTPVGGATVSASILDAYTSQGPADLESAPPAAGDHAGAYARVAKLLITYGAPLIAARLVTASAHATCTAVEDTRQPAKLTGASQVVGLVIDGQPVNSGSVPQDIALAGGVTLHINNTTIANGVLTQRAIWLQTPLGDTVLGEAVAGEVGNPCE